MKTKIASNICSVLLACVVVLTTYVNLYSLAVNHFSYDSASNACLGNLVVAVVALVAIGLVKAGNEAVSEIAFNGWILGVLALSFLGAVTTMVAFQSGFYGRSFLWLILSVAAVFWTSIAIRTIMIWR